MAYIVMAYIVMGYIVMACIVMAYIVMAYLAMADPYSCLRRYNNGLYIHWARASTCISDARIDMCANVRVDVRAGNVQRGAHRQAHETVEEPEPAPELLDGGSLECSETF